MRLPKRADIEIYEGRRKRRRLKPIKRDVRKQRNKDRWSEKASNIYFEDWAFSFSPLTP